MSNNLTQQNMTTMKVRALKAVALVAAALSLCSTAKAQQQEIVYSNARTSLDASYGSALEFGDEVVLDGIGRDLFQFQFEYFADVTPGVTKQVIARIYDNTGAGGAPGNLVWESDPIDLVSGYSQASITGITGVTLPDRLTWSIVPLSLTSNEKVSALIYDPPSVGSSANDFWQRNALGGWSRQVLNNASGSSIANFGARIVAVPEPSTNALLLAGAGYLAFLAYKRRSVRTA